MLNPTEPDDSCRDARPRIAQTESSHSVPVLPPMATPSRPYLLASDSMTLASSDGTRPPRRILTPRLPPRSPASLHRAASLNQLPSTAHNAQQNAPFIVSPRSRPRVVDLGNAGAPALPTPPAAARQTYGFSTSAPFSHPTTRRASLSAGRGMRPVSESTSPKSSYSGYSQAEHASPAQYGSSLMPKLSASYTATSSATGPGNDRAATPLASDRQGHMGGPVSSSGGQNAYQMMTLETSSGTVQLPVDVQAASRVADEKRRRNAGASARFRQRRKEKEREASTAISRLEQQLKDLAEDADFYKRERDYFVGVLLQVPGGDRHFPRPPSPRHRRLSSRSESGAGGAAYPSGQEQRSVSPGEVRNVRRRTSTSSFHPQPHGHTPLPGSGSRSYFAQSHGQQLMQHNSGPLPSPGIGGMPPLSGLMHAAPQPSLWNPYSNLSHTSGNHGHGSR